MSANSYASVYLITHLVYHMSMAGISANFRRLQPSETCTGQGSSRTNGSHRQISLDFQKLHKKDRIAWIHD